MIKFKKTQTNQIFKIIVKFLLQYKWGIQHLGRFHQILDNLALIRNDRFMREVGHSQFFPLSTINKPQVQNLEKNLKISRIPLKVQDPTLNNQLYPRQPQIKITQLGLLVQLYFINEFGLVDSQKNTDSVDIRIGRSNKPQKNIPIDIDFTQDRTISRFICRIVCDQYFNKSQIIDPLHQRVLRLINLPPEIIYRISQCLEQPKYFIFKIQGAFRIPSLKSFDKNLFFFKKMNNFFIGKAKYFTIVFKHSWNQNLKQSNDQWCSVIQNLKTIKFTLNHEIPQSEIQNQTEIIEPPEQIKSLSLDELYKKFTEYEIPILIVKFSAEGLNINKTINLLEGKIQQDTNDFFIGRVPNNNVNISSNTLLRRQSWIQDSQKHSKWIINDGFLDRDSANGTRMSLQTVQQLQKKAESNLIEVHQNVEIKITIKSLKGRGWRQNKQFTT